MGYSSFASTFEGEGCDWASPVQRWVYARTPMTTIPVTTPTSARRLIAAARTVACEGRTATVASVAGSAINRTRTRMARNQPTAP